MGIIGNRCGRDESVDDAQKSVFEGGDGIEVAAARERMGLGKNSFRSKWADYPVNMVRKDCGTIEMKLTYNLVPGTSMTASSSL